MFEKAREKFQCIHPRLLLTDRWAHPVDYPVCTLKNWLPEGADPRDALDDDAVEPGLTFIRETMLKFDDFVRSFSVFRFKKIVFSIQRNTNDSRCGCQKRCTRLRIVSIPAESSLATPDTMLHSLFLQVWLNLGNEN